MNENNKPVINLEATAANIKNFRLVKAIPSGTFKKYLDFLQLKQFTAGKRESICLQLII